jgi:hypothetical protein
MFARVIARERRRMLSHASGESTGSRALRESAWADDAPASARPECTSIEIAMAANAVSMTIAMPASVHSPRSADHRIMALIVSLFVPMCQHKSWTAAASARREPLRCCPT